MHSRPSKRRLPTPAQNSVGTVAQIWIGADMPTPQKATELAYRAANLLAISGAALVVLALWEDDPVASRFWTICGAWLALVGAVGTFWSGRIRDRYSDARTAWRTVTHKQRKILVNTLRGHQIEVWNSWVGDDPEATLFRHDIDAALVEAGVKTKYFSGWAMAVGLKIVNVPGAPFDALTSAFLGACRA